MKITFFEKTGCINNTKQKEILTLAGHELEVIDLIKYPWTKEELLSFFEGMEVAEWFNPNAPMVATGIMDPAKYNADQAIKEMLKEHLLIKRPLLNIGGEKLVGFDTSKIGSLAGLNKDSEGKMENLLSEDLDTCPQKAKSNTCDK